MMRQRDLSDLLSIAAAMARAPAAYIARPNRGELEVVARFGPLPDRLAIPAPPPDRPFLMEVLPPLGELAQAPWRYAFQIRLPLTLTGQEERGTLCILTCHCLDPRSPSLRNGLDALTRQIEKVLERSGTSRHSAVPSRASGTDALPSIDDLPGIGTFEIRYGSHLISLSSELVRLTGVPTGKLCSIDAFLRCMPVPDADLMRFAAGTSSEIRLHEADFAVENFADRTRRWVRRRAEVEVDEQGNAWRMIGTLEDMTRDRIATNRLSAMVMLGDALREVGTPLDAYRAAASALGDALGADRAGVAEFEGGDEAQFRVSQDWHGAVTPSSVGVYDRAEYKTALNGLEQGLLLAVRAARDNIWLDCVRDEGAEADAIRAQLLMPILHQGRLTHCLFVQCCKPRDWSDQELAFLRAVTDRAQAAAASLEARAHQETMHQELAHRLKNTLALVQALANQSLRGVENRDAVKAFEKRLIALASAHDLLMRQEWQRGDLETLAQEVLMRVAPIGRCRLEGPRVSLGPNTSTTLSLMLHELGTNAVKYGALSVEGGEVSLVWTIMDNGAGETLSLHWLEKGGPMIGPPHQSGFGTRLLKAGFGHQGAATLCYPETGCDAVFTLPLRQARDN